MIGPTIGVYSKINELPEEVQNVFYNDQDEATPVLIKNFGFTDEQLKILFDDVRKVFLRQLSPLGFFDDLKNKLVGVPEDKLKVFLGDYIGHLFLPINDFFDGDALKAITALGGDPAKYPATRITIRTLTPGEVVSEVLHENTIAVPARLDSRLRETMESFVRGVRTQDDMVHRLARAEKIGGVGLTEPEAIKLATSLSEKAASIKINFSAPVAAVVPEVNQQMEELKVWSGSATQAAAEVASIEAAPTLSQVATPAPVVVPMSPIVTKPVEVKREINISQTNVDFERQLSAAATRIAGGSGLVVPKELNDRFMAIIAARLKEARKANETMETLKKPALAGGMGFSDEAAQKTMDLLEGELMKIQVFAATAMQKEKEEYTKKQSQEAAMREKTRANTESSELDKLYGKLSGKIPAPTAVNLSPRGNTAAPSFGSPRMPSPVPPSAPMPAPLTPAPKMQDIRKVAPHLTGPADELRNMTLVDFRRLSSDPMEACRKLNDKLLLLEEQSYAERVEGVKAWQESPLTKLYLSVLNESFGGGGGVAAVVNARAAAGKETPTEAEVRAIMDFNKRLKS